MSGASVQRQGTQIGDIRFDDPKSIELKSAVEHKDSPLLSRRLKRHALADDSPTRNIPINTNRLSFVSTKPPESSFKKAKVTHNVEPQTLYHEFMALDQAGSAIMAFDGESELFVIKKYKRDSSFHVQSVRSKAKSDCMVSIIEAYTTAVDICIVYEYMDVVLRHILATPRGHLVPHEIAAVCREVIHGLLFVHNILHTVHGAIDCGQVLVNRVVQVKIANVGESMLRGRSTDEQQERKDVKDVGLMMIEMMEPETSLTDPETSSLRYPEKWQDATGIKSFLCATKTSSLQDLEHHPFLPPESTSMCLRPHVLMAQVSAQMDWTIFSQT